MGRPVIVCFVGGTVGDTVSQIIDPSELTLHRQKLKKPHLFASDQEKNIFLDTIEFKSVPSHDFEYHCKYNHHILGIVCRQPTDALWAAYRFKNLHRPHVWKEMTAFCGADSVEAYSQVILDFGKMVANYTANVLYLDEIINGHAVKKLNALGYETLGQHEYANWLVQQR